MTPQYASAILQQCAYPGLRFDLGRKGEAYYLQVVCEEGTNNATGAPYLWKGRKWAVSEHATKSELVSTALKAVLTAVEHEAREKFLYRGRAIFGPHFDVDKLAGFAALPDVEDVREEPE